MCIPNLIVYILQKEQCIELQILWHQVAQLLPTLKRALLWQIMSASRRNMT